MKSSARFLIGQCSLLKNRCNRTVRGSAGLATSWRGGAGLTGAGWFIRTVVTGTAKIPAITNRFFDTENFTRFDTP
jgi:hypothetical protein